MTTKDKKEKCDKKYCVICGRALKENKKGYENGNRRFHPKCKDEAELSITCFNETYNYFKDNDKVVKGYEKMKSLKDYFNFKHIAKVKTPNTEETKEADWKKYWDGQVWLMNKRLKGF